jgi:hypothetical protein
MIWEVVVLPFHEHCSDIVVWAIIMLDMHDNAQNVFTQDLGTEIKIMLPDLFLG